MSEREYDLLGIHDDDQAGRAVTAAFDDALRAAGIVSSKTARCVQEHAARLMVEVVALHCDHQIPMEALRKLVLVSLDSYATWLAGRTNIKAQA